MQDARALLDGLMGTDRNEKQEQGKGRKFSDKDICKKFLLGLCPHEMFKNTKVELRPCSKVHNEHLKELFEADKDHSFYRRKWRGVLRTQLKQMVQDVDRRINMNTSKIAEKESGAGTENDWGQELKEEVSEKLKQAEQAADDGKFERSRAIMKEVDATKRRLEDLDAKKLDRSKRPEVVCDVCGLMVSGAEYEDIKRQGRGWHTDGKQHLGFLAIRAKLSALEREAAEDRRNGLRTPSASPIRVEKPVHKSQPKVEERRPKAERSPRRKASPSPRRKRQDDRKRKASRSKSKNKKRTKRRKGSRSRSPAKGQKRSRSNRRKGSRSRSRKASISRRRKRSRSESRSSRSQEDRRKKAAKHSSAKRRSRSVVRPHTVVPLRKSPESEEEQRCPSGSCERAASVQADEKESEENRPVLKDSDRGSNEPKQDLPPSPLPEPIPAKPVRFVLGLGKLNVTALGKL